MYCYLRKVVGINEIFLWLDLVNFGYDKTWKMQYHNHKALYSMRRWSENESGNLPMDFLSRNYTGSYWNEVQWCVPFCLLLWCAIDITVTRHIEKRLLLGSRFGNELILLCQRSRKIFISRKWAAPVIIG